MSLTAVCPCEPIRLTSWGAQPACASAAGRLRPSRQLSKVRGAYLLARQKVSGPTTQHDAPVLKHIGPVGPLQRKLHILLDQQDAQVFLPVDGVERPEHIIGDVGGKAQ